MTGTLVLAPSGVFTYTPPLGSTGRVTFTYRANDGLLLSPVTMVTIAVNAFKLYLPLVRR